MYGGTLNMGSSGVSVAQPISLQDGGGRPGQLSVLTQTGGVINAWGGIQIGGAGTFTGGSAMVTNSGGFLYYRFKGWRRHQVRCGCSPDQQRLIDRRHSGCASNLDIICSDDTGHAQWKYHLPMRGCLYHSL